MKTKIIAEIGINHNGDLDIAKKLIEGAVFAGCDIVKFQKRTVEKCYSKEELDKSRQSPWGSTNREQKLGLEFGRKEYDAIAAYCREKKIAWMASAWDADSQMFLRAYDLPYNKVASAMLTNRELLELIAEEKKYSFISTGMSDLGQIDRAVAIFRDRGCPFELLQCCSCYPSSPKAANLRVMETLRMRYNCKVGYSSHHVGLIVSCAAVARGASTIEAHITLDRAMYGSDQAASIEVMGFYKLVRYIRSIEEAIGDAEKNVSAEELEVMAKLRKTNTL